MYVKQIEDDKLPVWLKEELNDYCPVCGEPMMNFYAGQRITNRKCSNEYCPSMLAKRVEQVVKRLGQKGIGYQTALKWAKAIKPTNHLQLLESLGVPKPTMSKSDYMKACCIEGIDTSWESAVEGYESIEEFVDKYNGKYRHIIDGYRNIILGGLEYVDIIKEEKAEYQTVVFGNVMMTGDIYSVPVAKREEFIDALNVMYKGLINIRVCGKRKTGVMALIKEENASVTSKVETALENGIPIMTPLEFIKYIDDKVKERTNA